MNDLPALPAWPSIVSTERLMFEECVALNRWAIAYAETYGAIVRKTAFEDGYKAGKHAAEGHAESAATPCCGDWLKCSKPCTPRADHFAQQLGECSGAFQTMEKEIAALTAKLEQAEPSETCEDCDHGIRGGKPCESCGGTGVVLLADLLEATQTHVKELKAKLEQAEKDARRYRWLRDKPVWSVDQHRIQPTDGAIWEVEFYSTYGLTEDQDNLDDAIDAAMKEPHA